MSATFLEMPQRSAAWFAARAGRLTGACAASMLAQGGGLSRAALLGRLVAERRTGRSLDGGGFSSPAMRRGIEQEGAAVAAYEARTGRLVRPSGFLSHNELMVGCSLDGHVGDPLEGILEVKCLNSSNHFAALTEGARPLALNFRRQVTHNLWVSGAAWCDVVRFDDRFPDPFDLVIVRVHPEELDIAGYEASALAFLADVERELARVAAPRRSFAEVLAASLTARAAIGAV
jgi:hypothetical protein